jgi:NAD(P)-dependent dehydrogenase (short-subunit alcohol dehydrogenase family)
MDPKRYALVTGANKGIGFAAARGLAKEGMGVFLGARDPERGKASAAALAAEGLDVRYLPLDLTQPATFKAAREEIERSTGRLDVLVNNAAIGTLTSPDLRVVYETNVLGTWAVTREFIPLLSQSAGRIINVSTSLASLTLLSNPGSDYAAYATHAAAYASSKTALNALTIILAMELEPAGIRVNAVCPGFCATDLNGMRGTRTPEEGARIIIDFAVNDRDVTGGIFNDAGPVPW